MNIFNLDRLAAVLVDVPFAVYAKETLEIIPVIDSLSIRHSSITVFGDRDRLLTKEIILEEGLLANAKRFNAKYNATMSELMAYPADERSQADQWESLSSVKKDSSAYQTAHRPTKKCCWKNFWKSFRSMRIRQHYWSNGSQSWLVKQSVNVWITLKVILS